MRKRNPTEGDRHAKQSRKGSSFLASFSVAQSYGLSILLCHSLALPYTATARFCSDIFVTHPSNTLPLTPYNFLVAWKRQFIQTHLYNKVFLLLLHPPLSSLTFPDVLVIIQMACCHVTWPIFFNGGCVMYI